MTETEPIASSGRRKRKRTRHRCSREGWGRTARRTSYCQPMCATLDREFSRLQELYTTADDPTLSRDAGTLPVEAADNWTEFVRAKGKLVADARTGDLPLPG